MIFNIIKRIVFSLCILYSINIVISKHEKNIPINIYTIVFVFLFDFFGIIAIIILKYYS